MLQIGCLTILFQLNQGYRAVHQFMARLRPFLVLSEFAHPSTSGESIAREISVGRSLHRLRLPLWGV